MEFRKLLACFDRRYFAGVIAAALAVIVAAKLSHGLPPRSAGRVGAAIVQTVAMGWVAFATGRGIGKLDELQQRLHLTAIGIAFGVTAVLGTGWGFLSNAGLPQLDYGTWLWPAMTVFWAVSVSVLGRRYH